MYTIIIYIYIPYWLHSVLNKAPKDQTKVNKEGHGGLEMKLGPRIRLGPSLDIYPFLGPCYFCLLGMEYPEFNGLLKAAAMHSALGHADSPITDCAPITKSKGPIRAQ